LLVSAVCQASAGADYVVNADEIVNAADWTKMRTVTVEFDEYSYDPDALVFEVGQPYKVILKNLGEKKHYFTAAEFYKAIATRKVQSNTDGEIKAPYFTAIELMVGGQLDLYFVPVTPGEYPVFCTIKDHREEGMEGKLVIR
jgi:uncharacterized cupredoxin-like copper-binding protein